MPKVIGQLAYAVICVAKERFDPTSLTRIKVRKKAEISIYSHVALASYLREYVGGPKISSFWQSLEQFPDPSCMRMCKGVDLLSGIGGGIGLHVRFK
jgi:hypothetical protein